MKKFSYLLVVFMLCISAVRAAIIEYDLPHTFDMERLKDVPLMTTIDGNNDGNKWEYTTHGDYTVMYILTDEKPADDWLILPAVKMKKSHVTRLRYTMRSGAGNLCEAYEIKVGTSKTVAGMTITVVPLTELSSAYYTTYEATIAVPADGAYHIGFHALSEAGASALVLDKVELEQGRPANVPRPVTDLKVEPAAQGGYAATLSFTAPQLMGSGQELAAADITGIDIKRDGVTITTLTGIQPGQLVSYTDQNVPNGDHEYTVVVNSPNGVSDAVTAKTYVGYDEPYNPRNLTSELADGGVLLKWDAVKTEGPHYHYVDPARITYNIYLYDEENGEYVQVATTAPGATSYLYARDTDAGEQQVLLFAVEAADVENNLVSVRRTESSRTIVGLPYDLPYNDRLDMNSPYSWFTLEEAIGTTTDGWTFGSTGGADNRDVLYVKCAYPSAEAEISSGKINVQGAVKPMLTFQYYLGSVAYNDDMEVIITRNDHLEPMAVAVCDRFTTPTSEWAIKSINLKNFITPDTRWITIRFKAYGAPPLQDARDYQMLSNIRVMDVKDADLALSLVSASKSLKYNGAMNMSVKVQNMGSDIIKPTDYTVVMYKNGQRVSDVESVQIQPFAETVLPLRYVCSGPDEADQLHFEARVESANDPVADNNSVSVDVSLVRPQLPQVSGMEAGIDDFGKIFVSWQKPQRTVEAVSEDFDSYDAFSIGEDVLDDYTIYFRSQETDYCGNGNYPHAGEPLGWLVFDNIKAGFVSTGAYAPHSGSQCLVAFDGKSQMDTWLITPELSGEAQTISFYTGALTGNWGPEQFNVLYSVKGTDKGDFIALNSAPLTEADSWAWTKRSFDVPEGAKYFAIQVISKDKMGFKIDDLCYQRVRGLDIAILGYNVYVDGILQATVPADTDPLSFIDLDHEAQVGVSILTDWGEGTPAILTVDPASTAIRDVRTYDAAPAYDLMGRPVTSGYRGIVIKNKRAYIQK